MKIPSNKLIAFTGRIGSGKDTMVSAMMYLSYRRMHDHKFADKLKDMVCILIGCTRTQLEDRDFKDKPLDGWGRYILEFGGKRLIFSDFEQAMTILSGLKPLYGDIEIHHQILTPRIMMQLLGTDCGRNLIHPDIWVKSLFDSLCVDEYNTISDLRYQNEAKAIKDRGGIIVKVVREWKYRYPKYAHLQNTSNMWGVPQSLEEIDSDLYSKLEADSEKSTDDLKPDILIVNRPVDAKITIEQETTLWECLQQVSSTH